jgi:hypothetical protein
LRTTVTARDMRVVPGHRIYLDVSVLCIYLHVRTGASAQTRTQCKGDSLCPGSRLSRRESPFSGKKRVRTRAWGSFHTLSLKGLPTQQAKAKCCQGRQTAQRAPNPRRGFGAHVGGPTGLCICTWISLCMCAMQGAVAAPAWHAAHVMSGGSGNW